ncbi:MAG: TolC family protein [Pseudomonadota bacterium]|nr:TolC family protein [Pseudomonadota bacterium]
MFPMVFSLFLSLPAASAATLEEAWAAAEGGGTELRIVREQRVQAETVKVQAWSLLSPKLVLGGTYTINEYEIALDFAEMIPEEFQSFFEDGEPIVVNKKEYLAWNASVIQPLFSGQALPLFSAATLAVKASRLDESAQRTTVRSGIAQAYYGVVVAREAVDLAERALLHAKKHEALAIQQVDVGLAPPTAKLQAEIGVSRTERSLAAARQGKGAAEEALARLTGWPIDTPVALPEERALPYADRDAAEARAQGHRPEILSAEHMARAAKYGRTAANLAWLPTLDGRFTWSYTENTGFSDDKDMWQVVFMADWVLWDGGARIAQQQKRASEARMAGLAAERVRETTNEAVRGAWGTYESARVALGSVEREVELSRENLRLAEVGFASGSLSFLEVEDARVGLLSAELGALQERTKRDLAALTLLAATGDL